MNHGYYRFPTIFEDRIVFVSEDDLWQLPASGGRAERLTAGLGLCTYPAFSPDGTKLAYIGREEGQEEVYLIPACGGPSQRLTFIGDWRSRVAGWNPAGEIIFCTNHHQPIFRWQELWKVPSGGGEPKSLNLGPARAITFGPNGELVLGRNTDDPRHWKRDRGGTIGTLWIARKENSDFHLLIHLEGDLGSPMWVGERIYFLSDHEGIGNLYSCLPDGNDIRRHSQHSEYYAYNASSDGKRIVYHAGAELYLFDPTRNACEQVKVEFNSPRTQQNRRFVSAQDYLESWRLGPKGDRIVITTRGRLFSFHNWAGAVIQHGQKDGVRYRLARWLNDGQRLLVISDQAGEEDFVIFDGEGVAQPLPTLDIGRVVEICPNPKKEQVAFSNQRNELFVLDLSNAKLTLIGRSEQRSCRMDRWSEARGVMFDWSADGEWLAFSRPLTIYHSQICLWQASTGLVHPITEGGFKDESPSFDPQGNYLYFISYRSFTPYADNQIFGAAFPKGMKLFLVPLRADTPSPFGAMPQAATAQSTLQIDLEGIEKRILALPVEEGQYGRVFGLPEGKLAFSSYPLEGLANNDWESLPIPPGNLCIFDLASKEIKTLAGGVFDFHLSTDRQALILRQGARLRVIDFRAGFDPTSGEAAGPHSGWIDLERVKLGIQPHREWEQMFREAWRLERDFFWTADMSGVDWEGIYQRYRPLVQRVSSRSELSALIWEMQSELGIGHAYEDGGDHRCPPKYRQGHLGADLEYDKSTSAWRITHIVRGDCWDEKVTSPLAAPGLGIQEGDSLKSINGQALDQSFSPEAALVNLAGSPAVLGIQSTRTQEIHRITIQTLKDEMPARYREWVSANRDRVRHASGGRLGYLHIPDMENIGIAEFMRGFLEELELQGLLVDVRYNTGGYFSPLILEKLARRKLGFNQRRWAIALDGYPPFTPPAVLVGLANEFTGSDGDMFSRGFQLLGLGPLVGKRTWGGIVGISPRNPLVDATITTQPEIAFGFPGIGWGTENHGVDPDIEVENRPQEYANGFDAQLERGIQEALHLLEAQPTAFTVPPAPDRSWPRKK
jgi:tricorn protease